MSWVVLEYRGPGSTPEAAPRRTPERVVATTRPMRSVAAAYLLWALCAIGPAGIHRFYAGRYVTGLLWLCTWGLLGVGLLVDLFLIPGMIEEKNRELACGTGS